MCVLVPYRLPVLVTLFDFGVNLNIGCGYTFYNEQMLWWPTAKPPILLDPGQEVQAIWEGHRVDPATFMKSLVGDNRSQQETPTPYHPRGRAPSRMSFSPHMDPRIHGSDPRTSHYSNDEWRGPHHGHLPPQSPHSFSRGGDHTFHSPATAMASPVYDEKEEIMLMSIQNHTPMMMHTTRGSIDMHTARAAMDMHRGKGGYEMLTARGSMDMHSSRSGLEMGKMGFDLHSARDGQRFPHRDLYPHETPSHHPHRGDASARVGTFSEHLRDLHEPGQDEMKHHDDLKDAIAAAAKQVIAEMKSDPHGSLSVEKPAVAFEKEPSPEMVRRPRRKSVFANDLVVDNHSEHASARHSGHEKGSDGAVERTQAEAISAAVRQLHAGIEAPSPAKTSSNPMFEEPDMMNMIHKSNPVSSSPGKLSAERLRSPFTPPSSISRGDLSDEKPKTPFREPGGGEPVRWQRRMSVFANDLVVANHSEHASIRGSIVATAEEGDIS